MKNHTTNQGSPKKRGRPASDWRKVLKRLQYGFAWGFSLSLACESTGISRKTVYNLRKIHPEFARELEIGRNLDFESIRKHIDRIPELSMEELVPKIYHMQTRGRYRD